MLKKVEQHKTLVTGVVIAVVGTLQASLGTVQEFIPPLAYALTNISLGVVVAGIGAYNTLKAKIAAAEAAAKADEADESDEAGV